MNDPIPPEGPLRRSAAALRRHMLRDVIRLSILLAGDALAIALVRIAGEVVSARLTPAWRHAIATWVPIAAFRDGWQLPVALVVGLVLCGTYGRGDRRRSRARILCAVAAAGALVLWSAMWTSGVLVSARHFVGLVVIVGTALVLERLLVDWLVIRVNWAGRVAERVIFVGDYRGRDAATLFAALVRQGRMDPIGWSTLGLKRDEQATIPATADAFAASLLLANADTVVLCGELADGVYSAVTEGAAVAGCRVLAVSRYRGVGLVKPALVWERGLPFFEIAVPALRAQQLILKRALDIVLSTLGLVITAPLAAMIAVAIKLDSRGPSLFVQKRIGRDGRAFRVFKFRTMVHGAPDQMHRDWVQQQVRPGSATPRGSYKLGRDPRVTRVGRFLRRTSLDELPQLLNVLRGEMSLVGPRPPLAYEVEAYEPWQFERLRATPGITGLWQVSGRSRLPYHRMCELDVEYVKRWSIWLDLKILMKTIPVVVLNSGRAA